MELEVSKKNKFYVYTYIRYNDTGLKETYIHIRYDCG